ncbi:hypothetical protein [uncultured Kordia sp.]|uniref:hypothetical protein n=1 Tax=uncultured Kordia sp. TaxID=507699 RepID=UPI00263434C3|nr:hypothetical protein [uncultured Kordia sp.]
MKKRTIKSLELNKKTISNFETAKVNGGSTTPTNVTVYTPVTPHAVDAAMDAVVDAVEFITDYFN